MLHTKQTTKALEIINSTANLDFILFDLASIHGDVNRLLAQLEAMKDLPACIFIHSATFLTLNHEHWHPNFTFIAEKPLLSSDFPRLINDVLLQDDNQTDPKETHHGINIQGMRILLAEDNSINQLVVKKLLETQGCVLDIAEDGVQAVALFEATQSSQAPDYHLILMDCEMPGMDGYMATEKIRAFEQQQAMTPIAIFALTAHALPEYVEKCEKSGMNGVISKPFEAKSLLSLLMNQWQQHKRSTFR